MLINHGDEQNLLGLVLRWFVLPFIPLFFAAHLDVIFYLLLLIYVFFFIYINHYKNDYHWIDSLVFIGFFLFFALIMKSLISNGILNEGQILTTAVIYGTID